MILKHHYIQESLEQVWTGNFNILHIYVTYKYCIQIIYVHIMEAHTNELFTVELQLVVME